MRLPTDPRAPLLMVGPGTGCAIFRSFLQHRLSLKQQGQEVGPCAFFFGCRHEAADFLYADEWQQFVNEGVLSLFGVAFSRDTSGQRVYVQHKIAENASAVRQFILSGGYFYLSGRASKMPTDVRNTLKEIMQQQGAMIEIQAEEILKNLERQNRYSTETWS